MIALWILGILALVVILLLQLRVGTRISFGEALHVTAKIGPITVQILPRPEKKKKPEATASSQKKKPEAAPAQKGKIRPTLAEIKEAAPVLFDALKRALAKTRRRMRIDPMRLCVIFGGEDPVEITQLYGWANTVMWTVMPPLEELLQMPDPHIHLEPNFESKTTHCEGELGLSFRVGDLINIALTLAIPVLRWYLALRKKQRESLADAKKTTQTA